VKVFDVATGESVLDFLAYEASATAGVRLAVGDFNGDGYDDVVTSYAQESGRIRIFDGLTGDRISLGGATELNPFSVRSNSGAFVAAGDVTGDGRDDIIVGAGFHGKKVKVYDGVTGQVAAKFNPFGNAALGVRVAVGDLNGDGIADIIAGQRSGASGVRAFAGGSLPTSGAPELLLKTKFGGSDGVFVAAGDVTGDGRSELILGSGERSPSKLSVYSPATQRVLYETPLFVSPDARGVRVGAVDINLDGIAEIVAAPSGKANGEVLVLNGADGTTLAEFSRKPFPNTPKLGIYVAGTYPVPFVQPNNPSLV
jgi:serralysin